MEVLLGRGHQVSCLCTSEVSLKPWLHWSKTEGKIPVYRVFNAGVYPGYYSQGGVGTRRPRLDVRASGRLRRCILDIIQKEAPELISIQSIFGLPFQLLEEISELGYPTVYTAHDYFSICPTAHLFTSCQQSCRLKADELVCNSCCQNSLNYTTFWISYQIDRWIERQRTGSEIWRILCGARNLLQKLNRIWNRWSVDPDGYRLRRNAAVQSLKKMSVIHCISEVQASIMNKLTGGLPRVRILPLYPPSLPSRNSLPAYSSGSESVRFAALNVYNIQKGSMLLNRAFSRLEKEGGNYRLDCYGPIPEERILSPKVHYHGRYDASELDQIASNSDFCIMPSVWDETLGFVGMEMMARGVPLLVSSKAGVTQFVEHDRTGYLFDPECEQSFLELLKQLIANPESGRRLRSNLQESRKFHGGFEGHVSEMVDLFRETIGESQKQSHA